MKSPESFNYLVLNELAELFNAQLSNFTFYAFLPNLPTNEADFSVLIDTIPVGTEFFDSALPLNYFSKVYGRILNAQINQPLAIQIGLNDYNNATNWIVPYTIPKYTPSLNTFKGAIGNSSQSKIIVKSNEQVIRIPVYPEFPVLVVNTSLDNFTNEVAKSVVTVTIAFSESTTQKINFGNWFSSAAFLYAYQTPSNWDDSVISWDEVFNPKTGILKNINSYISAVSDMTIKIHISGTYTEETVSLLTSIPEQVIFPFYQQINGAIIEYTLETDKSLTITLKVPKNNQYYLFGVQYQNVEELLT